MHSYNKKFHGPLYEARLKVLLHSPVVPVGKTPKFFTPWKGPQVINDVTYRIQDLHTKKELVVHYDRLKPFKDPPPTSNVPSRDKQVCLITTSEKGTHYTAPTFDQYQCNLSFHCARTPPPVTEFPLSAPSTPTVAPPIP